jgi:hypothetical protein
MKFMMEIEQNRSLQFVYMLVSRKSDGSLGHTGTVNLHTQFYMSMQSPTITCHKEG